MVAPAASGIEGRRLAAILAADVVGWSRGVAENEAGALAAVRALRTDVLAPALAAHGGRLFKAMGDGFLAEFHSAVEAASCAVVLQRRLLPGAADGGGAQPARPGDLVLRVGVALGDVVVERDGDVLGAGVNLAARLQAAAEPGEIVVSRVVHEQLAGRLAFPFEDRGERTLKNIPDPVRIFALTAATIAALPAQVPPPAVAGWRDVAGRLPRRLALAAGGTALILVAAAGVAHRVPFGPPTAPVAAEPNVPSRALPASMPVGLAVAPLSIAVLPFADLSGSAEQHHVAEGITDDVTNAVGRISHVLVIGRGSAATYRRGAVDARQAGRELGVRYVVSGSTRRDGDRLSVNAELMDTTSGAQLWSAAFDEPFGQLPAVSGAIAQRLAVTLDRQLYLVEAARGAAERPGNPTALDLMLRGRILHQAVGTFETYGEARRLFERAVELDPGSAQAHALLAHILTGLWSIGWPEDREGLLQRAQLHVERALSIDAGSARAYYVQGVIDEARQRFDLALAAFDLATERNPNFVFVHARRGWVMLYTDRPEDAAAEFRRALTISPREPGIGGWHNGLALAALMQGRDAEAVEHTLRAVVANPGFHLIQMFHAGSLALVGRKEEARIALANAMRLRPDRTAERIRREVRERSRYPLFLATQDRLTDALVDVGLPEG